MRKEILSLVLIFLCCLVGCRNLFATDTIAVEEQTVTPFKMETSTTTPTPIEEIIAQTVTSVPTLINTRTPTASKTPTRESTPTQPIPNQLKILGEHLRIVTIVDGTIYFWDGYGMNQLAFVGLVQSLNLSPDGKYIVFSVFVDDSEFEEIKILPTDGSAKPRTLIPGQKVREMVNYASTTFYGIELDWVPGNRQIIFKSVESGHSYSVDIETMETKPMLTLNTVGSMEFSPDYKYIVVITHDEISLFDASSFSTL